MEKLIELLNVYRKEKYPKSKLRYYKYDSLNHEFLSNCIPNDSEEKVLGRRFGFIQRLVRENKIDFESQAMQYVKSDLSKFFTEWKDKNGMSDDCTMLLMLLAIQENPISFLISILK